MPSDSLQRQQIETPIKPPLLETTTPEEIRRRLDDAKDSIHGQIRSGVLRACGKSQQLKDSGLVDDLIQEVSIKVWRHAEDFDSTQARLTTWIFTIAKNTFIDKLREIKSQEKLGSFSLETLTENQSMSSKSRSSSPEEEIIRSLDSKKSWANLIKNLNPEEKALLEMKFQEDLKNEEIAEQLKVPLSTVKNKFFALFGKIRKLKGIEKTKNQKTCK